MIKKRKPHTYVSGH